jgi:hypothetical protein
MLVGSRVAAQLAASQEGLSSMSEWIVQLLDSGRITLLHGVIFQLLIYEVI